MKLNHAEVSPDSYRDERYRGTKQKINSMNILITGIHGFVGSNLVRALKVNHTIYGLDIMAPQKEGVVKTYTWAELETIPVVDVVIHLAGKAHDTKNQTDAQVYFEA